MEEEIKNLIDKIEVVRCFDNREEREKCLIEGKVIGAQTRTGDAQAKDKLSLVLDTGYQIDLVFKEEE